MINKEYFWSKFNTCRVYNISELPPEIQEGINTAKNEREKAYAPYSNYAVAAVIITKTGKKISSVNSETCNYDSICAEAGAIAEWTKTAYLSFQGSEPKREEITCVIIVGGPLNNSKFREDVFITPCGRCRQRLYEHCSDDTIIVSVNESITKARIFKLFELLPFAFSPNNF